MPRNALQRHGARILWTWPALAIALPALATTPWDALTPAEVETAAAAVRNDYPGPIIFNELKLARPDKAAALTWQPGQPWQRRAEVVFLHDGRAYEGQVALEDGNLTIAALPGRGSAHAVRRRRDRACHVRGGQPS